VKKIRVDMVGTEAEKALSGIGDRLRFARGQKTLDDVANFMGCNKVSVSRYEACRQIPDVAYLLKYAEFVKRSASWLLTGDEPDETALSQKESSYILLTKITASILEKTLQRKKLRLNYKSAGNVFSMLFKHAIILTHEGATSCGDDGEIYADIEIQLEDFLDDLISVVSEDIFLQDL